MGLEVERSAGNDGADHGEDRPGKLRREPLADDEHEDHAQRDGDGRCARGADVAQRVPELCHRVPTAAADAEHAGDLPGCHLDADAGEEADEHRAREEVGEEAQAGDAGEQQQRAGEDREHPRECDVVW